MSLFFWLWEKYVGNVQEWKIINNFHVRVRRRNKVTGKYVSMMMPIVLEETIKICWTAWLTLHCLSKETCTLHHITIFVLFCVLSLGCCDFGCEYQCSWLPEKAHLINDLWCDIKLYTLTHSQVSWENLWGLLEQILLHTECLCSQSH